MLFYKKSSIIGCLKINNVSILIFTLIFYNVKKYEHSLKKRVLNIIKQMDEGSYLSVNDVTFRKLVNHYSSRLNAMLRKIADFF